jgi:hypothetical protein
VDCGTWIRKRCRVSASLAHYAQKGEMAIAIGKTKTYLDRLQEENSRVGHIKDFEMASCESRVSWEAV